VERAAKEAEMAEKAARKALREAKKAADKVEEAITGKSTCGQKRKHPTAVDAPKPKAMVQRGSEALELVDFQMSWWGKENVAPVANDMRLQYEGCRTRSVCWHTIKAINYITPFVKSLSGITLK
jgi:hypothetical protein